MDRNMLKSLEAWIGDNPNVIPESIVESLMSAASTSASEEANVATGETGGVSAESSLSQSEADSITDETPPESVDDGEDKKADGESSEEMESGTAGTLPDEQQKLSTRSPSDLEYTPDMYFATTKNDARRKFRHILRMAATEAKAYGVQTYRQLSTKQKYWITDRVIAECPELKGYERKISDALITTLIQAKQYLKRKKEGKVKKRSKGEHSRKEKSDDNSKNKKKVEKRSEQSTKESGKGVSKKIRVSTEKQTKRGEKGKEKKQAQQPLSDYEKMRQKNMDTMNAVLTAAMKHDKTSDGGLKPGDDVVVFHREVDVAKAYYISDVDAMYAEVIFVEHLDKLDDLELPRPVKRGSGHLITMFVDLEKNDKFLWKRDKIKPVTAMAGASSPARRSQRESRKPARFCRDLKAIYQDKK